MHGCIADWLLRVMWRSAIRTPALTLTLTIHVTVTLAVTLVITLTVTLTPGGDMGHRRGGVGAEYEAQVPSDGDGVGGGVHYRTATSLPTSYCVQLSSASVEYFLRRALCAVSEWVSEWVGG